MLKIRRLEENFLIQTEDEKQTLNSIRICWSTESHGCLSSQTYTACVVWCGVRHQELTRLKTDHCKPRHHTCTQFHAGHSTVWPSSTSAVMLEHSLKNGPIQYHEAEITQTHQREKKRDSPLDGPFCTVAFTWAIDLAVTMNNNEEEIVKKLSVVFSTTLQTLVVKKPCHEHLCG